MPAHNSDFLDFDTVSKMTESQYIEWARGTSRWRLYVTDVKIDTYIRGAILHEFSLISQSKLICEIFSKLQSALRSKVEDFNTKAFAPYDIEEFSQLALRVQDSNPNLNFNEAINHEGFIELLWELLESYSLSRDFDDLKKLVRECGMLYHNRIPKTVILMLCNVYGVSRVTEVLTEWTQSQMDEGMGELIAVTRDWENVKEYPISWAISLSRGEISE